MTCEIRAWKPEDAKALAALLSNRKILDNLRDGIPYPYGQSAAAAYISAMLSADANAVFARAIAVDGKTAGSIGAFRQQNIHSRTAELGYYLAEEYWGQGIMSQAVSHFCQYLFAHTDLLRIYAEPFARNVASCRVLEKAGFVREGVMRKNAVKNGLVEDMVLYALVREEKA